MKRLGLITIGESPRHDVTTDLLPLWPDLAITEVGLLDGLDEAARQLLAPHAGEDILVSRLANGSSVTLSQPAMARRMVDVVATLSGQVDGIMILCTGSLPELQADVPLFEPDRILRYTLKSILAPQDVLGVVVPKQAQEADIRRRWQRYVNNPIVTASCNPYEADASQLAELGAHLYASEVDYVVLDCIGYSQEMKDIVQKASQCPVIIPRTLVGRLLVEFF